MNPTDCTCTDHAGEILRRHLAGEADAFCPYHDATEIQQRETNAVLEATRKRHAEQRDLIRQANAALAPTCSCVGIGAGLKLKLSGLELPTCAVHDTAPVNDARQSIPLDDDRSMAALLGFRVVDNDDGPLDAA